jgi:hypothetical protein
MSGARARRSPRLLLAAARRCSALAFRRRNPARRGAGRDRAPELMLLTSLPLVFGESSGSRAAARRR